MPFEPLGKLLPKSLKKAGAQRRIIVEAILEKAGPVLDSVFGPGTARRMRPESFRDGELVVACDRFATAQEIGLRAPDIIEGLNLRLGSPVVRRVRAML